MVGYSEVILGRFLAVSRWVLVNPLRISYLRLRQLVIIPGLDSYLMCGHNSRDATADSAAHSFYPFRDSGSSVAACCFSSVVSFVTRVFRVLCARLDREELKASDASTHTMTDSISETSKRAHPYKHTVARISEFVVLKIAESVR